MKGAQLLLGCLLSDDTAPQENSSHPHYQALFQALANRVGQFAFGPNNADLGFKGQDNKITTMATTTSAASGAGLSIELEQRFGYSCLARVSCKHSADADTTAQWLLFIGAHRDGGGSAELDGMQTISSFSLGAASGCDVTADVSGNDLVIYIAGEASQTYRWTITVDFNQTRSDT